MSRLFVAALIVVVVTASHAFDLKSLTNQGDLGRLIEKSTGEKVNPEVSAASGLSALSNQEAIDGLKLALNQSASKAVDLLGVGNGFFGNNEVKIPLPESFKKVEKSMKLMGMAHLSDELVLKMNRAAEAAVPEAKALLVSSIKQMSLSDAKSILAGSQDAATQYFKKTTSAQMAEKFLPVVQKATENVGLVKAYNQYAGVGSRLGLIKPEDASIEKYVTQKTLDGLYLMIAKEEAAIRANPLNQASGLLKKVFGSIS
ncbi:MAG: hypothetical protein RJB34_2398 [Pseudomonadota bacterium]